MKFVGGALSRTSSSATFSRYDEILSKLITLCAICMSIALVAGQQLLFGQLPSRQLNLNSLEFGQAPRSTVRDPRQNRGPVVFPPSPPDAIEESSGVVVGASGYGFVPPQQRSG